MVAAAEGCRCHIVMPDDAAVEKVHLLEALGAAVQRVRPVSIAHPDHFVNVACRLAAQEVRATLRLQPFGLICYVTFPSFRPSPLSPAPVPLSDCGV